jgi:site-specific recombinase XerD
MKTKKKLKEYVRILERKRKTGTTLFLLYTLPNGIRKQEATNLTLVDDTTKEGKAQNEITMLAVEKLKAERTNQLISGKYDIETTFKKNNDILLLDYVNEIVKSKREENTKKIYITLITHITKFSPKTKLSGVGKKWVLSYIEQLKERGIKPTSIRQYCTLFSAILKQAVRDNLIKVNPFSELTKEQRPTAKKAKKEYLTKEEINLIASKFPQNTDVQKFCLNMFLFGCYTGLRFSDIQRIKWEDIKEDASNGKLYFNIEMKKTKDYVKGYLSQKALATMGTRTKGSIFPRVSPCYIDTMLKETAKTAGINKNISFHTSRHSFAVNLLANGLDIYSVSRLLGHTDIKTTQIYLEMIPKKQIEGATLIDKIF